MVFTTLRRRSVLFVLACVPALLSAAPNDAPVIEHVGIDTLTKGQDLVVEATVSGPRPIVRVSIAFQVGDGFGDVALARAGSSSTWRGRVPSARLDRSFSYIIHATDHGRSCQHVAERRARPRSECRRWREGAAGNERSGARHRRPASSVRRCSRGAQLHRVWRHRRARLRHRRRSQVRQAHTDARCASRARKRKTSRASR